MQRLLIPPDPLDPLPVSSEHYVPVLQLKPGERRALETAEPTTWSKMTPVIEVSPWGDRLGESAIKDRVRDIADAVGRRPFYVDFKGIAPSALAATSSGKRPVFEILFDACRRRGLNNVPVLDTRANPSEVILVRDRAAYDGRGVALRHRADLLLGPGMSIGKLVAGLIAMLELEADQVDLLVDLGFLSQGAATSPRAMARMIRTACKTTAFRSVVLIATVVPRSMGGGMVPENSLRTLDRHDWALWRDVASKLDRPVAFGDYGVQHPKLPPSARKGRGMWANVRYTTSENLIVARGREVGAFGTDQYATLCDWIASRAEFRGSAFSYGDREIHSWASSAPRSLRDPVDADEEHSPSYWRGVGTSHHLALVTEQLASTPPRPQTSRLGVGATSP